MIAEINESKTLNLMVENVTQIKRGIKINVGTSVKIKKKHRVYEKDYIWNHATFSYKNVKYH